YLVSAAAVVAKPPGELPVADLVKEGAAYALSEPFDSEYGEATVASAGDTDGDGLTDFLIGVSWWNTAGTAYLVSAADLPHLDAADGRKDHRIDLSRIVTPRP
ncbi:MAG: integrin alpha, partial [Gammaproteobacteria bacterium]|nr:integrin alpha [Gammaproteobacteria bacterium]